MSAEQLHELGNPIAVRKDTFPDPFPAVTFAKKHRWGLLDHWAWRRLQRLGVPNPWAAYLLGREHERGVRAKE